MKLLVTQRSGKQQVLNLKPPFIVADNPMLPGRGEGPVPRTFDVLTDASGVDYYFHSNDGTYDGWGGACNMTESEAKQFLAGAHAEEKE